MARRCISSEDSLGGSHGGSLGVSLAAASLFWLKLGWISFGGPAGQIALLHRELVEERKWLSDRHFLHALNFCMVLPGPEATQLATYLGWLMHGVAGGLVAGLLFVLPSVIVLIALSTVYVLWGQLPLLASIFWALKPAVLALVIQAAWRVGRRTLHTPVLGLLAVFSFVAFVWLRWPYPLVVAIAAAVGWLLPSAKEEAPASGKAPASSKAEPFPLRHLPPTLLIWGLATALPLGALGWWNGWDGPLVTMGRFFSQVALVSFGGAYAVLPYVAKAAVSQFHWLSASQMVDGLALGETTPGPLIMVLAFVGFMGGWNGGVFGAPGIWWDALVASLVVVWFTFLPSFGFIFVGAPLMEASREDLRLQGPLSAITAAVVGVIASLVLFFSGPVLWPTGRPDLAAAALAALGLLALIRWRWSVLQLIGAAALVGVLAELLH
ncbi:chromate efflux transporter [Cyanobium sp. WAJ14-Wanaka]|uniref:chromate efflux transporter n=1 Tax=Cyanobium sp. WAJ14-Wanaka TaxID=2823725 RepID=UPI0020CD1EC5|nr:chromate efflux transporter [Cyanobium sp. WAJ14-Wanaka]MCP9774980.1 chromate efflux transporter [Cyanobium sp. WAJ14-Wanaka]